MKETMDKQIAYLEFINRENSFHHHRYEDDMRQFEYLKNGDLRSLDETKKMMDSGEAGHLSDDPLKNLLYLNICHATLCTRFAISVRELANMVKLNESYLSVLFKREVGINITEYIIIKRMETAENMLKYSDFSLSEISNILHFSSYSHFARTFRKYYNISPKQYRSKHYRKTSVTE